MDPNFWSRLEAAWLKQSNSAVPIMNVPQGKGLDAIVFRHASSWLGIAGMNMRILKYFERHFPLLLIKAEHLKYHTGYTLVWIEFKNGVDTKMLQNQDIYTAALRGLREYHSFDEASMIPYLNKYHDANYSLFHDISSLLRQPNTHALSPEIVQALVKATTGVSMVPVAVGHHGTNPEVRLVFQSPLKIPFVLLSNPFFSSGTIPLIKQIAC